MDRVFQPEPARQPAKRAGLAAAADQQVDRAGCPVALPAGTQSRQERLQPLEREVVADEQTDQVAGLQPESVAEGAADRARLRHREPLGIDRVGHDVDLLTRNVMKLFEMPLDHVADRDDPRTTIRVVLLALDRAVQPVLGIGGLGQQVESAAPAAMKNAGRWPSGSPAERPPGG